MAADAEKPSPKTALPVAAATIFLAGATDVYGLTRLKDIFVSFMSGNTTLLGVALGQGDWAHAGLIAGVVALFVAGAAAGAILAELTARHHAAAVMGAVTLLLVVPLVHDAWAVPALVLAMGALNDTMSKLGATSVGLTYVTGALAKFGAGAGRWIAGTKEPRDWLLQGVLWTALLVGATAAAFCRARFGAGTWPLPALSLALLPLCIVQGRRAAATRRLGAHDAANRA